MKVSSSYQDPNTPSIFTCKVQRASLAPFHACNYQVFIKTLISSSNPNMQGAKCKILHICTSASIKFLSRSYIFINPYMQGAECKILHICTHASIKLLSRPYFFINPACNVHSAKSCTFAHVLVSSLL